MSEPALSEVPVQRTGPVAGRAPPGTAAGPLCPCGVHPARPVGAAGLAEQERDLRTVVSGQRRDAVDSGLALDEFLRRFFLHVLPRGFVRIRHFGFFAHRRRAALLPLCLALLGQTADSPTVTDSTPTDVPRPLWLCPQCAAAMAILERFTAAEARFRSPPIGQVKRP
jgi:hypothetical protein